MVARCRVSRMFGLRTIDGIDMQRLGKKHGTLDGPTSCHLWGGPCRAQPRCLGACLHVWGCEL
jgi:hypothetical protein